MKWFIQIVFVMMILAGLAQPVALAIPDRRLKDSWIQSSNKLDKKTDDYILVGGLTELVSKASNGILGNSYSWRPSISDDGRYVAFSSFASNLVSGDTNDIEDIFVHDRQTGATERVSVASDGTQGYRESFGPSISGDGRFVAFLSFSTNLVSGDTNGNGDIFVHDRLTGSTERVSVATDGTQGNGTSIYLDISFNGRYVAFDSYASNLVSGDTNEELDVFISDRLTGSTERVSLANGGQQANGQSAFPSINHDGRYVAYHSHASNLVSGDTNEELDVFISEVAEGPPHPSVDLSIVSVTPVQVIEGQPLVRDKATAIKVEVNKTGEASVDNVQLSLSIGSSQYTTFYVADSGNMKEENQFILEKDQTGYPLDFSSGDETETIYFIEPGLKASGTSLIASVVVDPQNTVPETNENNNNRDSDTIPVYDTHWGPIFPDLDLKYFRIDYDEEDTIYFSLFTYLQNSFIRGVFPIAENRFNPENLLEFVGDPSAYRPLGIKLNHITLQTFIIKELSQLILAGEFSDRYVGLVPPFWFKKNTNIPAEGIFYPLTPWLVIGETLFNENNPSLPNGISPVAHELGHSYGLWRGAWPNNCEEYEEDLFCTNPSLADGIGNYSAQGIWVEKRIPMQVTSSRKIYCFMGKSSGNEYWVDEDDYGTLLNNQIANKSNLGNASFEPSGTILAIGTIDNSNIVSLENWYLLPQSDTDPLPDGPYSFVYLNNLGEVINELPFDVVFELDNGYDNIPVDSVPFVLRIPYVTGTESIEIRNNGTTLAEKLISQNAPAVNILSPNGDEIYDQNINITWEGSDADGDELTYTVLLSQDDGTSWVPLAGNLSSTNLEWNIKQFGAGGKYRVKVIATDGFNTGEDLSDQAFSIIGRIYLPLSIR